MFDFLLEKLNGQPRVGGCCGVGQDRPQHPSRDPAFIRHHQNSLNTKGSKGRQNPDYHAYFL
jgi:hypothetical protein